MTLYNPYDFVLENNDIQIINNYIEECDLDLNIERHYNQLRDYMYSLKFFDDINYYNIDKYQRGKLYTKVLKPYYQ